MIFVTVGTQLGFERLVRMVDAWAGMHPQEDVFVQSGGSSFIPQHCRSTAFTGPDQWEKLFQDADRVISHAGMGTIIKSLACAKPLIIMPRQASLGEHRNDHQLATAERFARRANISVINNAAELAAALSEPALNLSLADSTNPNLDKLLSELKRFVQDHC